MSKGRGGIIALMHFQNKNLNSMRHCKIGECALTESDRPKI
jgi:hypothetical protein